MSASSSFRVAVLPGDGIGPEVIGVCHPVLRSLAAEFRGFDLELVELEAGAELYSRTRVALPEETFDEVARADAVLFGAMGLPDVRTDDGREIAPQLDLRERLELYAGVRPLRAVPGLPLPLADPRARDLDVVLIREQTEGLFAERESGTGEADIEARDSLVITRPACERLFDFTFALAGRRQAAGRGGRVTCVDKSNVLQSFAFFRQVFDERAEAHPHLSTDHCYVDAMAMNLVTRPWSYDLLVTENLLGDILSDLGAALIGGMGMAPSADIGEEHGLFQPCHGTAPDIVGSGRANPTAMLLSAAMMLDWLGETHGVADCVAAATRLRAAVDAAFASGELLPFEFGGSDGTEGISSAILRALESESGSD